MTATRVRGWRSGRRPRRLADKWVDRQAKQFADAQRARLTQACERVLRQVYPRVAARLRRPAGSVLDLELRSLIADAAAEVGEPADSLDVEVCLQPMVVGPPRLSVEFKMPEHSDQEHLRRVLGYLALEHGGRAS